MREAGESRRKEERKRKGKERGWRKNEKTRM